MAEETRLRSMEESICKTEYQLLELQQFMNSNREFMDSTKNFIEESRAQHEGHRLAIAEQGKKTESQFTLIAEMFRSLMEKSTSLPANPSIQSTEGILAPNPAAAPRSAMRQSSMGENLPEPAKLEVNSGPGDNSHEREILVFPSYGPVEPDPTSFSSEISELLSLKVEENQSSAPSEIHQDAFIKNTSAYQVIRKSHQKFEDDQPDSLQEKRSSAPTLSNIGIDLNFKLGLDDRRALSPSTEQQKSDFRRGISTFPQTEFLDFNGMQLSWVRSVNGFDGIIEWVADSVETIELNLVDSMEFLETPSARKVFVEMPSRIVMLTALVDEKITNENGMELLALQLPYDRGKCKLLSGDENGSKFSLRDELVIVLSDVILALFASGLILFGDGMVIFYPGGGLTALDSCPVMLRSVGKSCLFLMHSRCLINCLGMLCCELVKLVMYCYCLDIWVLARLWKHLLMLFVMCTDAAIKWVVGIQWVSAYGDYVSLW